MTKRQLIVSTKLN